MKLVSLGCGACGAEWDEVDRGSLRRFCPTCGAKQIDKLLFGGQKRAGDLGRLPRDVRIEGAARLLGYEAKKLARENGDWSDYEEHWLASYRRRLDALLVKEGIVLEKSEEDAAAIAFENGWDRG